jgi:5-methylcytosine-specific restriction endonuclease McrA
MTTNHPIERLSDDELLTEVKRLARVDRCVTVDLVRALIELDSRRLYLGQGCASLFVYCTRVLRLSEHAAYARIEAARAARRFPAILDLLHEGAITLTTVTLLGPHLTETSHRVILDEARLRSKREVEQIVARLRPRPDVAPSVRKAPHSGRPAETRQLAPASSDRSRSIPESSAVSGPLDPLLVHDPGARQHGPGSGASARTSTETPIELARAVPKPLAPDRYSLKLTIPGDTHAKLRRAQDLLRHAIPTGDLTQVFDRALTALLREIERKKLAATNRPRTAPSSSRRSRYIPAAVRREVWARDGGRCTFVGPEGRCGETAFLEFHHLVPYADCGATDASNLQVRCRAHNQHEAEQWFGPMVVRETLARYSH